MRLRFSAISVVLVLLVSACSSGASDSATAQVESESPDTTVQSSADPAPDETGSDDAAPEEDTGGNTFAAAAAGGAQATMTLENGESYTFNILCALEPQEAAGQTILFTVVSYDDPVSLDVTQFGEESFGGNASISLYDSETYDDVWKASELHGAQVELELNGKTVTGSGIFVEGVDGTGPGVAGELVAECGS